MSEAGPFTELQRSEGKRKAVESEANRLAHEAAKLSALIDRQQHAMYDAWKLLLGEAEASGRPTFALAARAILAGQLKDYAPLKAAA